MRTFLNAALAAALMLSAQAAWAEDIVSTNPSSPTPITTPSYTDGATHWWGTSETLDPVYGLAESLTINNGSTLQIGTNFDGDDAAPVDMTIDIFKASDKTGQILVGDSAGRGLLDIGWATTTADLTLNAGNLFVQNGEVNVNATAGKTLVNLQSLVIDRSVGGMVSDNIVLVNALNAALHVANRAYAGDESFNSLAPKTGKGALQIIGSGTWLAGGIDIGYGGYFGSPFAVNYVSARIGDADAAGVNTDIVMYGDAILAGGDVTLTLIDDAADKGLAAVSSLVVDGTFFDSNDDGNNLYAMQISRIDATSLKGMQVKGGRVEVDRLSVRDYQQSGGDIFGDDFVIAGTSAKVTGGYFSSDVEFTNAALKSFDFAGTGFKDWYDDEDVDKAYLWAWGTWWSGGVLVQGAVDAGQSIEIGRFAEIALDDGTLDIEDMDINVSREGGVLTRLDGVNTLSFGSFGAKGSTLFVEDTDSIKFDYQSIWAADHTGVSVANPVDIFVKYDNADVIDVEAFRFDGMFGYFDFGMAADTMSYGLVGWADNGIKFDGTSGDADNAHASIRPFYGKTVQRGLSDMAYRAGITLTEGVNLVPSPDLDGLEPINGGYRDLWDPPAVGTATREEWDSFNFNMLNLANIAAGRADASIVGLLNGSAAFGVNQVSASTALTHAQIDLRRSDELRIINNFVKNSVSGSDAYASSIMNSCFTNRFWAGGFGLWENAGARRGFDGYKYKSGGVAVGYDRMFGPNVIVGASFAATFGDYEDKTALAHNSDIDSYSFNLFATYTHDSGFFASAFGGYTYSDNDIKELRLHNLTDRLWNTADYHTNTWMLGGKLGYDWKPSERFSVTPSVGVTWINARSSAHTEYMGGVAVARYGRMKTNQTYLPVELGFGYDAYVCNDSKLNLAVNFGYAYNFDNDRIKGSVWQSGFNNGLPYAAVSREPGHHTFTVAAACATRWAVSTSARSTTTRARRRWTTTASTALSASLSRVRVL